MLEHLFAPFLSWHGHRRNVGFLRERHAQRIEIDQLFVRPLVEDPQRGKAQAPLTEA
jgi:hypothetical protein